MSSISAVLPHPSQGDASQPRLVQAAHEFEAQLMKELLHPLTNTADSDGDSDAGSGGVLADFAAEALGQSLSSHGGLGIATSIVHSLSRSENASRSVPNQGDISAFSTASAVVAVK